MKVRMRSKTALRLFWFAATIGAWLGATAKPIWRAQLSPNHSNDATPLSGQQAPRQLTYSKNVDSFVTLPLPQLLKAVPRLKGLEPDENQAEFPQILQKVGANVKAFFEDFPNTASAERISMEGWGGLGGAVWETHTQKFQYLALARPAASGVGLDEYRTNAQGQTVEPGGPGGGYFVTKGFVSTPIHFYPDYQADSAFRYLGRQVISKQQTYVVAFAQRPGIARATVRFGIAETSILVLVQGIAWIDSSAYQVLRMRTDLLTSEEDFGPKRATTEIEFQAVRFKESSQVSWLPREVVVTADWRGNIYRNRHRYSNFKLFTVGTEQKVQTPEDAHPEHQNPN